MQVLLLKPLVIEYLLCAGHTSVNLTTPGNLTALIPDLMELRVH